jgi:hypothetical protein
VHVICARLDGIPSLRWGPKDLEGSLAYEESFVIGPKDLEGSLAYEESFVIGPKDLEGSLAYEESFVIGPGESATGGGGAAAGAVAGATKDEVECTPRPPTSQTRMHARPLFDALPLLTAYPAEGDRPR